MYGYALSLAGRSARRRDAREHRTHGRKLAATRDKEPEGGQPPNTAGGNTTRGETAHRGTPPANMPAYIVGYRGVFLCCNLKIIIARYIEYRHRGTAGYKEDTVRYRRDTGSIQAGGHSKHTRQGRAIPAGM